MQNTPQFIRWAIEHPCPLRQHNHWQDPERTERELRSLRAFSDAVAEKRIVDGICVDTSAADPAISNSQVKGFYAQEILDAYGGQEFVESQCLDCPANAVSRFQAQALAGCHGWFELSEKLQEQLENAVGALRIDSVIREAFPPTTPNWYGLWINSPLNQTQSKLLEQLLQNVDTASSEHSFQLQTFVHALSLSSDKGLSIHVVHVPRGHSDSMAWTIISHCPRCKAEISAETRHCRVCGRTGHPHPERRRNTRGSRPYRPLEDFLGPEQASNFLAKYLAETQHPLHNPTA